MSTNARARAIAAFRQLDRDGVTYAAVGAAALGASDVISALIESRPDDRGAIRGAIKLADNRFAAASMVVMP